MTNLTEGRTSIFGIIALKEIIKYVLRDEYMRKVMVDKIGEAAMYEQLAEEAAELAQAALKVSRMLRGDNPPRKTPKEVWAALNEEVADVWVCFRELDLKVDPEIVKFKEERFLRNWEEAHKEDDNS